MREADPSLDKQNTSEETLVCCLQCGWPGTGIMPAGVALITQDGKTVLVGNLSYFRVSTVLCSLCQEMEAAMASRPWFVKAHVEYLDQIQVKKEMLGS